MIKAFYKWGGIAFAISFPTCLLVGLDIHTTISFSTLMALMQGSYAALEKYYENKG